MAVPLEVPAFLFTYIPKGKCGRGRGREGEREIECRERWGIV